MYTQSTDFFGYAFWLGIGCYIILNQIAKHIILPHEGREKPLSYTEGAVNFILGQFAGMGLIMAYLKEWPTLPPVVMRWIAGVFLPYLGAGLFLTTIAYAVWILLLGALRRLHKKDDQ